MGIRFKKSIQVLPGLKLNISKSGISTTIGPKGASVNVGKNGTYINTGIPGTGVYMREKISGEKNKASTIRLTDSDFKARFEQYKPIRMKISENGSIWVIDKNNKIITDEAFLNRLEATNTYKEQKENLIRQQREANGQK